MLWSYYISTVWDDPEQKSSWRDPYVFCMEVERDVNSRSYIIDVTEYWHEGLECVLFERDEKIERGLKEKGWFVDKENMEIWVPETFNKAECLEWLKIAVKEIFGDDSVELSEGSYEDFAGTNADSIAVMICSDMVKKMEKESGSVEQYTKDHPEEFRALTENSDT
jgi:hypothetical protein